MGDLEVKKIFVGGLSPDTSEDDLKSHFGVYGDIEHCEVKKDPGNQYRSKGFGFVTFVEDTSVDKALGAGAHNIGGRSVDTKRATKKKSYEPEKPKKCFLGGIPNDLTDEQIREQFDQFGEIVEVVFPTEKGTEKRRGFAFVTYNDPVCVENAVAHAKTNPIYFPGMNEKPADVKPATPREQDRGGRGGFGGQRRGGFGGRGGRGGGYGGGRGGGYGGGYGGDRYGGSGGYDSYNQGGYNSGYGNNGYSDYNQGGGGGYSGYGQGGGGYDSYSSGGGGYGQQSYGGGGGGGDYGSYGKAPRGGQRKPRGGYQPY